MPTAVSASLRSPPRFIESDAGASRSRKCDDCFLVFDDKMRRLMCHLLRVDGEGKEKVDPQT